MELPFDFESVRQKIETNKTVNKKHPRNDLTQKATKKNFFQNLQEFFFDFFDSLFDSTSLLSAYFKKAFFVV